MSALSPRLRSNTDQIRSSEAALRDVFSRFGTVQTCIVNAEKRHAFIKMISRADAVAAREGMETYRPPDMQLRVRRRLRSQADRAQPLR